MTALDSRGRSVPDAVNKLFMQARVVSLVEDG